MERITSGLTQAGYTVGARTRNMTSIVHKQKLTWMEFNGSSRSAWLWLPLLPLRAAPRAAENCAALALPERLGGPLPDPEPDPEPVVAPAPSAVAVPDSCSEVMLCWLLDTGLLLAAVPGADAAPEAAADDLTAAAEAAADGD